LSDGVGGVSVDRRRGRDEKWHAGALATLATCRTMGDVARAAGEMLAMRDLAEEFDS
jgi:hypothetical protein